MIIIPILKLDTTPEEQLDKVIEELNEIVSAHKDNESIERQLEECFDGIEAITNQMYKIATYEQIQEAGGKLLLKLTDRGHDIVGLLKVTLE